MKRTPQPLLSTDPQLMAGLLSRRQMLSGMAGAALGLGAAALARPALAAETRHVSFVGWEGYDSPFKVGDFMSANSATLDTTYINATEDIITKLRAGGMGSVDFVTFNHMYNPLMGEAGLVQAIDTARLNNYGKLNPRLRALATETPEAPVYGVPFTFSSCPLLYNPKAVAAPPTSWKDFLKPEYENKIGLFSDVLTNIMVWAPVATGVPDPTRLTQAQLDQTIELLITLKRRSRAMPASLGDGAEMLIRGEAVMIMGWEPMILWCRAKGVEVAIAKPVEGTWGFVDCYNIASEAPNGDFNYGLLDHLLSVEAQTKFANDNYLGVANAEAVAGLSDDVKALYPFDDLDAYFAHAKVYPRMFPLESDGTHVTYEQVLDGYDRFLKS